MEKEDNIKSEISNGTMILKLFLAHILIYIGLNIICFFIETLLYKTGINFELTKYTSTINEIISTILAIKIISKKYILKENINIFINKIITFLIIFFSVVSILRVYSGYNQAIMKITACNSLESVYESALKKGEVLEPYNEDCKTMQDSIKAINKMKETHMYDFLVFPIIENNIAFLSQFFILKFYTKKKISNKTLE